MRKILYTDDPETQEKIKAEGNTLAAWVMLIATIAVLLVILAALVASV